MASSPDPHQATTIGPDGFVVVVPPGDRIHFLDWGGAQPVTVVLVHGLSGSAPAWSAVSRRLAPSIHVVAMDLRGHGLSDSPTEPTAYDLDVLASDVIAVADGASDTPGDGAASGDRPLILAGHGFGAIVAAAAAARLGERCRGLVLVDGGLADVALATGLDVEEFLRGLDEPPEVMRSMAAFLADRRSWDPGSWDDDQEQAVRATVVETPAGRLVPATRPHALEACVRTMFAYRPEATLAAIVAPIVAVRRRHAAGEDRATGIGVHVPAGIAVIDVDAPGHNLLRYRPDEVAAAILGVTGATLGG